MSTFDAYPRQSISEADHATLLKFRNGAYLEAIRELAKMKRENEQAKARIQFLECVHLLLG